jgi:transcriptional regulator with XRE-family HTH domain
MMAVSVGVFATMGKLSGERIAAAREELGMTQEELAAAVSKGSGSISRYERGLMAPRGPVLTKLARVLKKSPEWLVPDENDEQPEPPKPASESREPRVEYGDDVRRAATAWLDAYLKLRDFEPDSARWHDARNRVLAAAGDRGPTAELAIAMVDLFVAGEQGKLAPSAQTVRQQSEAEGDARRKDLEAKGVVVQPKPLGKGKKR